MQPELDRPYDIRRALRALPAEDTRPYDWHEFQRRAQRSAAMRGRASALAAALLLAGLGLALWLHSGQHAALTENTPVPAPAASAAADQASSAAADHTSDDPGLAQAWLASLPREPALVRVGTRADVFGLEDRIAQVDDLLTAGRLERTQSAHLVALQRERARLVSSLAQVRYAESLADAAR